MKRHLATIALCLAGASAVAQTPQAPRTRGAVQVACQGAYGRGDFAAVDRVYAGLMAETQPALRHLSEECVEALTAYAPSNSPDAVWDAVEQKASGWLASAPGSQLARLAHAKALIARATSVDFAGGSWAATDKYLDRADKVLNAQPAATRDTNWYVKKLEVAKRRETPSGAVVELMRGALAVDATAPGPYEAAIRALDTQRGRGDPAVVEWLAATAAEKTRATEGMARYARVYEQAAVWFNELRMNPFAPGRADWSKLQQAYRDLEKNSPADYRINLHAGFACLAKDKKTTSALLARIGANVDRTAWYLGPGPDWAAGRHYEQCKAWAAQGERGT